MVGRPSLEPEFRNARGARHRRQVALVGAVLAGWLASPRAWADAGSPAPEQPSEPPAEQVEAPEEPAHEQPEPEVVPVVPQPEEQLAQEEPMPPPGMVNPPPPQYVPPFRFNGRPGADEVDAPTRVETADGVTMLSNRPEQTEDTAAEPPTDPQGPAAQEVDDDEPAADTPTMAVLSNQLPSPRKGRKKADDDSEGLGWIWLLVGAAGLLLVPIGVLLNRGARRQTSIPPSRSGV